MNPIVASRIIMHALGKQRWVFIGIISLAIAAGVSLMLLEKGVRKGSAQVGNLFDLIVASPGSKIDTVLNLVYLQNESLEAVPFSVWHPLINDPRNQWASLIVKGDYVAGFPIIGVSPALIRAIFGEAQEYEGVNVALVGANTPFQLGQNLISQHGEITDEDEAHKHTNPLRVQARLPKSQTPWDNAILVPVEHLWRAHSLTWTLATDRHTLPADLTHLEHDHDHETDLLQPEQWSQLVSAPEVLAIAVKPKKLSDAYALRSLYNTADSMAFFPAEVLVRLHSLLGNARDLFRASTVFSESLVMLGVLAGLTTWMQLLTPSFALLRALGAPQLYVTSAIWLAMNWIMSLACATGLVAGVAIALPISWFAGQYLSMPIPINMGWSEVWLALGLLLVSSLLSLWPAYAIYRKPLSGAIRAL